MVDTYVRSSKVSVRSFNEREHNDILENRGDSYIRNHQRENIFFSILFTVTITTTLQRRIKRKLLKTTKERDRQYPLKEGIHITI